MGVNQTKKSNSLSLRRLNLATERRRRVSAVARALQKRYGDFDHYNRRNPLEELLFILCSVQTQECNYRRTFAALRKKFRTFEELSMASAAEIAKPLRSGGLYRHKSKRIETICARLVREFGRATLAPLRRMKDAECEAFLTSLPGVGLKVARCVLVYSLGRDVFPVDTHCWRISRRLGWIDPKMRKAECDDEDMERLQAMIPAELRLSLHVNFISLGREVCLDGKPKCGECPISIFCRHGQQRFLE